MKNKKICPDCKMNNYNTNKECWVCGCKFLGDNSKCMNKTMNIQ